jgi:hypothetical protein
MELRDHSQRFPSLAQAREDLNTAMAVADEHGRVQYARAAKDYAAEVACDPQSVLEEKVAARGIMVKAMAITGELSKFSRARQAEIAAPSCGVEID